MAGWGGATCQLPGCSRPVYVDAESGRQHEFCGRTHAREARRSSGSGLGLGRDDLLRQLATMGVAEPAAAEALDATGDDLGAALDYVMSIPAGGESEPPSPAAAARRSAPGAAAAGHAWDRLAADPAANVVKEEAPGDGPGTGAAAAAPPGRADRALGSLRIASDSDGGAAPQQCPFPIAFAVAVLSAGRAEQTRSSATTPRPQDLCLLEQAAAAEHAQHSHAQMAAMGLNAPPQMLGLAELMAEQILMKGRVPKVGGGRGSAEYPVLGSAVRAQLLATATRAYFELEKQLGLKEIFISLYSERPALEELHLRARWPIFAYKAKLAPLGGPTGLIALDMERDGAASPAAAAVAATAAAEGAAAAAAAGEAAPGESCWSCGRLGHMQRDCPTKAARQLPQTRRAVLHFFGARCETL